MEKAISKIKGALFGHAIGDALGVGIEGSSKDYIVERYPQGYTAYDQMDHFKRRRWELGEWSDDTEQMLCVLDSLLEKGVVDIKDIAKRFFCWVDSGGKGSGGTFARVVYSARFIDDPCNDSKDLWERSGRRLAANGGVMRTSILGAWRYWDEKAVIQNAEAVCRITHWDPRCVGSCVAVSYAISALLKGVQDIPVIYETVLDMMNGYDSRIRPYLEKATSAISELHLDEHSGMGYTLKALAAGFWAFLQAKNFEEGILTVINEGGDADTNGAVAGALLGAKFGIDAIPQKYIEGLLYRRVIEEKTDRLIQKLTFSLSSEKPTL